MKYRVVTLRVPEDQIVSENTTGMVLAKGGDPYEIIPVVSQPQFRITEDCNAFLDPTARYDIDGDPNVYEMKEGQVVEILACNLNQDAGYTPIRYTHISHKGERIDMHAYVKNQFLEHVSGNLGIRDANPLYKR